VFLNLKKDKVDLVVEIMQRFGQATRLRVNVSKSSVALIRCSQIDMDGTMQSFNGSRVTFLITYLRLPITLGRLRMVHLQPFLDRASIKLAGWQGKLLNLGGQRGLVATILSSLPTYLLIALKPPKRF
jgi:hypothetical protein